MNDKQREYLLKSVTSVYSTQCENLRKRRVKKPSLNNYLVAAFLDGSIEFADIENLKSQMRQSVVEMPDQAQLVELDKSGYGSDKKETQFIKVKADLIFKIPEAYLNQLALWQSQQDEIDTEISNLTAQLKTIEVKIHLGSNQQLDKLIAEADNLGEISLINSRLMLTS